jgi:hypothetical protein
VIEACGKETFPKWLVISGQRSAIRGRVRCQE